MPAPFYTDATTTIIHGDCIEAMRELADNSIDAIVTDPPYGLGFMGKEWDAFGGRMMKEETRAAQLSSDAGWTAKPYGASGKPAKPAPGEMAAFQAWCELWTTEALRVLKPGGHLLAFGGTRTWHRLACAIEDAGFEIRDSIAWLYGSGFPKSLDVSKAIDKAAGATREVVGQRDRYLDGGKRNNLGNVNNWGDTTTFGTNGVADVTAPATPEAEQWQGWGTALKPAFEPVVVGRKPLGGIIRTICGRCQGESDEFMRGCPDCGGEGYITRRVKGNVAANVLAHGTGALNIDACRIGTTRAVPASHSKSASTVGAVGISGKRLESELDPNMGRWPANVILDESQAAALDQMSGTLTSGANPTRRGSDKFRNAYGDFAGQEECTPARGVDSGGASRFFKVVEGSDCRGWGCNCPGYSLDNRTSGGGLCGCGHDASTHFSQGAPIDELDARFRYNAKAPKKERPTYDTYGCICDHTREQHGADTLCLVSDCWCVGFAIDRSTIKTNSHATVKPLALMRWLVRLVTPPGGVVLDPFAGSGTTVEAALLEGFRVIGIEREADYLSMILKRIERANDELGLFR